MASVLACLGEKGLADDVACIEALKWARYSDRDIVACFSLARMLARHFLHTQKARIARRERLRKAI
jgi:hypothetical protein